MFSVNFSFILENTYLLHIPTILTLALWFLSADWNKLFVFALVVLALLLVERNDLFQVSARFSGR